MCLVFISKVTNYFFTENRDIFKFFHRGVWGAWKASQERGGPGGGDPLGPAGVENFRKTALPRAGEWEKHFQRRRRNDINIIIIKKKLSGEKYEKLGQIGTKSHEPEFPGHRDKPPKNGTVPAKPAIVVISLWVRPYSDGASFPWCRSRPIGESKCLLIWQASMFQRVFRCNNFWMFDRKSKILHTYSSTHLAIEIIVSNQSFIVHSCKKNIVLEGNHNTPIDGCNKIVEVGYIFFKAKPAVPKSQNPMHAK